MTRRAVHITVVLVVAAGCTRAPEPRPEAPASSNEPSVATSMAPTATPPVPAPTPAAPSVVAALDLTPSAETLTRANRIVREASVDAEEIPVVERRLVTYGELTRLGAPVVVRFPLVQQSAGWGCMCPSFYVGVSPDSHGGGDTWLDVRLDEGVELPEGGRLGRISIVEGVFTGQTEVLDLRDGPDGPAEWIYHPRVVRVLRIVRPRASASGDEDLVVRAVRLYEAPERIACRTFVSDPEPPTRVRAAGSSNAAIVGELPRDTELRLVGIERGWLHVSAPIEGYVFNRVTRIACAGDP